jgi:hypothetical protein
MPTSNVPSWGSCGMGSCTHWETEAPLERCLVQRLKISEPLDIKIVPTGLLTTLKSGFVILVAYGNIPPLDYSLCSSQFALCKRLVAVLQLWTIHSKIMR